MENKSLPDIASVFRRSFEQFKIRAVPIFLIFFAGILYVVAFALVFGGLIAMAKDMAPQGQPVLAALGIAVIFLVLAHFYMALIYGAIDPQCGVKDAFRRGSKKIFPALFLMIFYSLIVSGGMILLFIPGIFFAVALTFAPFILAAEDAGSWGALKRSLFYVRGAWWNTFVKLILLMLMLGGIGLIPILGQIATLVLFPYTLIFYVVLYQDLKEVKGGPPVQPSGGAMMGLLALLALAFLVGGPVIMIMTGQHKKLFEDMALKVQMTSGQGQAESVPEFEPASEPQAPPPEPEPPVPAAGGVTGLVRYPKGKPLADVDIKISQGGVDLFRAKTDAQGKFRIDEMPPGDYDVKAWKAKHKPVFSRVSIQPGESSPLIIVFP